MAWHDSVMIAFDVETTGTDPETARIVSACAVQIAPPDPPTNPPQWLINPGVEIPAEPVPARRPSPRRHVRRLRCDP